MKKRKVANEETLTSQSAHDSHLDSSIDVTVAHLEAEPTFLCAMSEDLAEDLNVNFPIDLTWKDNLDLDPVPIDVTTKHSKQEPALAHFVSGEPTDDLCFASPIDLTVKKTVLLSPLSGELTDCRYSPIDLTVNHSAQLQSALTMPCTLSEELTEDPDLHLESHCKLTGCQEEPELPFEQGTIVIQVNMDSPEDQNYCHCNAWSVNDLIKSPILVIDPHSFKTSTLDDEYQLKLPNGWLEWKSHEQSKTEVEYGPAPTSSFYELYRLENKEIVVLKSVVVDHVSKTVETFMLGTECFSEPYPFESNDDLNLILEAFDAKQMCDGRRDDKFYNITIPIETGYFIKEVWRSDK